ncbi:MAG: hypothetical protein K6A89_01310 [Treponema sp.]|nr:hypothetical protein [Treponema sp.]
MSKKKYMFMIAALLLAAGVFSEDIELPDVTTVISGETEMVGEEALPDFEDVLELPNGSGDVEPELPEIDTSDNTAIDDGNTRPVEKSVYAEGLIGGGYPAFFTGNVSVARTTGTSPFKFSVEHESALGYAAHSLTDGYSDRFTGLSVEKQYKKNHFEWGAFGFYKSASDGLQKNLYYNGTEIGLLNRDLYNAGGNIAYTFDNGFSLGAAAKTNFYNRYSEITCPQIRTVSFFSVNPQLLFRWTGYGFETGFTTDYDFDTEFTENIIFPQSHRVKFMIDLSWKNDYIKIYGNASAVIGKNVMANSVIVPFTIGIDSSFPVYFANRRVSICAEGGIDSYKPKSYELEGKYKFTNLNWNPTEVSEWYGRFNFSIPLKSSFTGSAGVEYRQTAYENGRWQPVYDDVTSIYGYNIRNFRGLSTDFNLSYHQGFFSVSAAWHSNWLDVPVLENIQNVKFDINFQDVNSKWGADVNCVLPIDNEIDTPVINAEGFVRITQSVRAILSVNDIIKLYKGETRIYAGKYAARSGSAAMLLKFFF